MSKQGVGPGFPGFSWNVADPFSGTRAANNFGLRLFVGGSLGFLFDPAPTGLSINADNAWAFIAVSYDAGGGIGNVSYYVGDAVNPAVLASNTTVDAGSVMIQLPSLGSGTPMPRRRLTRRRPVSSTIFESMMACCCHRKWKPRARPTFPNR
jgi:hypothetical protein